MQMRQLEYFVALAEEEHFARAARACFVSQPALSESLHNLEDEIGVQLVQRDHAFQGLTPEGKRMLVWARKILADYRDLKQDALAVSGHLTGILDIGSIPAASVATASLLDRFCARHPGMQMNVSSSMSSSEIIEAVRHYRLDAGLIYLNEKEPPGLETMALYREQQVLLAAEGLLGTEGTRDPWAAIPRLPLCLMSARMRGRKLVDQAAAEHGLELQPQITTDSLSTLVSLVSAGRWASVVSRQWVHGMGLPEAVRVVPLESSVSPRVGLVFRKQTPGSPALSALLSVAGSEDLLSTPAPTQASVPEAPGSAR
ncbi:LysR family transcriptional regulator [Curtobacterium sp. S6]|uniref:LysR family transcriptional regulator n=1 Tax=Curtobacterium sp. S6 TaxID=1479623 RepID=UPI0004AACDA5|nr:LysR family transcriptional regulator [Curtobacterium sp. S6]